MTQNARTTTPESRRERGFTLVELVVAILVLTIGL
ncbi:MAG: type IV pilus modification PilV family protein, partial [Planctomycetota bacterium]